MSSTYPVVFKVTYHFHLSKATNFKTTQGKGMPTINTKTCTGKKAEEGERKEGPIETELLRLEVVPLYSLGCCTVLK